MYLLLYSNRHYVNSTSLKGFTFKSEYHAPNVTDMT